MDVEPLVWRYRAAIAWVAFVALLAYVAATQSL